MAPRDESMFFVPIYLHALRAERSRHETVCGQQVKFNIGMYSSNENANDDKLMPTTVLARANV